MKKLATVQLCRVWNKTQTSRKRKNTEEPYQNEGYSLTLITIKLLIDFFCVQRFNAFDKISNKIITL